MEKIYYKGKGEHSVRQLETIIEQQLEEIHLFNSGQKEEVKKCVSCKDTLTDGFVHRCPKCYDEIWLPK